MKKQKKQQKQQKPKPKKAPRAIATPPVIAGPGQPLPDPMTNTAARRGADATAAIPPASSKAALTSPPPAPTSGRGGVDWVAAGKKAWETRQRNLALIAAGQPVPTKPRASSSAPTAPGGAKLFVRRDGSRDAYETRVLTAIERTTKSDGIAAMQVVGKDFGGGWVILGTDGHRALTHQIGTAKTVKTSHTLTTKGPLPFGFAITPEVESVLRTEAARDKKANRLWLTLDARRGRLEVRAMGATAPAPVTVDKTTLKSVRFCFDAKYLVDALGRGGHFRYEGTSGRPVNIDTEDGLRYVLMPMREPDLPKVKKAPAPTPTPPAAPDPAAVQS